MFHLRLTRMMLSRTSSIGALRLMAKFGHSASWAKRKIPGTIPGSTLSPWRGDFFLCPPRNC